MTPSFPLEFTTTTLPLIGTPKIPAIKVLFCNPGLPMRIVLDSPTTPGAPMSMLLLPVVRLDPALKPNAMFALEGINTVGRVSSAREIHQERISTVGRITVAPKAIVKQRLKTGSGVVDTCKVIHERIDTIRRVVAAARVHRERLKTGGGVVAALVVGKESINTGSGVEAAASIVYERRRTDGHVLLAAGVEKERVRTNRCITGTVGVGKERIKADGRVVAADCEAEEGISTLSSVGVGITSVRWWTDGLDCLRKSKAGEHERDEQETAPQRRPINRIS